MNIDSLLAAVKQVDLCGILRVEKKTVTRGGAEGIVIHFWRIRGAFKNDHEEHITMLIDPDGPGGDLYFYVPPLAECDPGDMALTIYMDANMKTVHGAHRWQAGKKGDVMFSYALPLPPGVNDFPGTALFQRLLGDMYEGLLFRELKEFEFRIDGDDMLSDGEKKEKFEKVFQMYKRLTSPKAVADGTV